MISRKKLKEVYEATAERRRHADAFEGWFKLNRRQRWQNFQHTKALFGQRELEERYLTSQTMKTKTKTKDYSEIDPYNELIQRLPLKPIKEDEQHERAVEIIGELLGRKLDIGTSDYLDTLILLVNKYEDERHTPMGANLSPCEALKAIMTANHLSQPQMGKIIGVSRPCRCSSRVSEVCPKHTSKQL